MWAALAGWVGLTGLIFLVCLATVRPTGNQRWAFSVGLHLLSGMQQTTHPQLWLGLMFPQPMWSAHSFCVGAHHGGSAVLYDRNLRSCYFSVQVSLLSCVWLFATHRLWHAKLPCLSPTPRACSNWSPSSWCWHSYSIGTKGCHGFLGYNWIYVLGS